MCWFLLLSHWVFITTLQNIQRSTDPLLQPSTLFPFLPLFSSIVLIRNRSGEICTAQFIAFSSQGRKPDQSSLHPKRSLQKIIMIRPVLTRQSLEPNRLPCETEWLNGSIGIIRSQAINKAIHQLVVQTLKVDKVLDLQTEASIYIHSQLTGYPEVSLRKPFNTDTSLLVRYG